ncbi:ABC transporter permease [Streptomyces sp. NPDC004610]|uniref:ABC transporter permease n=1 Tax=unclassified Streptomyces TaxID=2593676 RepID=UPI0033BB467A
MPHLTRRRALTTAVEFSVPAVLVFAWWLSGELGMTSFYFPALSAIWDRFVETWFSERFFDDVMPTLSAIVLGYAFSVVLGVALGVILARLPRLERLIAPLLEFFRAMPGAAIVPILIVIIGVGMEMKVFLVVFSAIWTVLLNTLDGVKAIEPTARDTRRSYRLSGPTALLFVTLPAASPQIVAGMRVALSQCIILIIISEMVVSSSGIGNFISQAEGAFDMTALWSGILVMAFIGFFLNKLFHLFEHQVLAWHRGLHGRTHA